MNELDDWLNEISTYKLPRWEELPELELYRDQLLTLVDRYLRPIWIDDTPVVTASMVNNYVKNDMMPAPVKKHYRKSQLAYLIVITFLKQVVSMDEIKAGIQSETIQLHSVEHAYNTFCEKQEAAISNLSNSQPRKIAPTDSMSDLLIEMVTRTFATKLITRKILSIENVETTKGQIKKGKK